MLLYDTLLIKEILNFKKSCFFKSTVKYLIYIDELRVNSRFPRCLFADNPLNWQPSGLRTAEPPSWHLPSSW